MPAQVRTDVCSIEIIIERFACVGGGSTGGSFNNRPARAAPFNPGRRGPPPGEHCDVYSIMCVCV